MAVKIARGTTGQADFLSAHCFPLEAGNYSNNDAVCVGPLPENYGESWSIYDVDGPVCVGYTGSTNGWNANDEGVITVPSGADPGVYRLVYNQEDECTPEAPDHEKRGSLCSTYEFEVVCMKVTIRPYTRMSS